MCDAMINKIAAELLCSICKKLPNEPVIGDDGCIYDRSKIDNQKAFPSWQIKRVVDILVSTGSVNEKYLWVDDQADGVELQASAERSHSKGNAPEKKSEDEPDEFQIIKVKAEKGDISGMLKLGELYLKGTKDDEKKGYYWFDKASREVDEGHDIGIARKADCLIAGLGVNQNSKEGRHILVQSGNEDGSGKIQGATVFYDCK